MSEPTGAPLADGRAGRSCHIPHAARVRGGQRRAAQPEFRRLQQERGRRGAAALRARYSPEVRRAWGQAGAAALRQRYDAATRRAWSQAGGQVTLARYGREALRVWGRRGGQVTLACYGPRTLLGWLTTWALAHPTALEQVVAAELDARSIPYRRQVVVGLAGRLLRLDFVIRRAALGPHAGPGWIVIEPGDRRWHGGPAETWDGRDHQTLDAARDELLEGAHYYVLRLDERQLLERPEEGRALLERVLAWGAVSALAA